MPSPNCSVLSPQANRVPGQRDLGSHSNIERQFSLLPACSSFLLESCPAFPSLKGWSGLAVYKTPLCALSMQQERSWSWLSPGPKRFPQLLRPQGDDAALRAGCTG